MPRSAFLEGAREAGGTKTCIGALAKQKTAAPQSAASLSLAVLESDGRKREAAIDSEARWVRGPNAKGTTPAPSRNRGVCHCKQNERAGDGYTRTIRKLARGRRSRLQRLPQLAVNREAPRRGNWRAGSSRFQNRTCSGKDASRALVGDFLFGF